MGWLKETRWRGGRLMKHDILCFLVWRVILAIQASSVPCERDFSDAALTDDKRRGRLSLTMFSAIQSLKSKYKTEQRLQELEAAARREAQKRCWDDDP
ncbi:hypothetical protein NEOLEDRAFT_1244401 [Neolentinus lepideus HHB14362 ss-1]|uniref:HAT C-terminal dimerisation domain-containing protein n=1 Tax=Neolentinus lepideus HHB14362 ss-1 TaxID=1314782 RepID=A0A165PXZ0_9AGAM|nr:hypothetical protein NEOLEDRAFT_1244401 [Neolentinus lepideus HHB14362 ss-1]